ncbi:hypothetical protein ACY2GD_001563 [Listeria monocytogenes]
MKQKMSSETSIKIKNLQTEKKKSSANLVLVVACATGVALGGPVVSTTSTPPQYALNNSVKRQPTMTFSHQQNENKKMVNKPLNQIFMYKIIDTQFTSSKELNAMQLLIEKIEKSTKEMAIVGSFFGTFMLSLPLYSDVSFNYALAASFMGFSLLAFRIVQKSRGKHGRKG